MRLVLTGFLLVGGLFLTMASVGGVEKDMLTLWQGLCGSALGIAMVSFATKTQPKDGE